MSVDGKTVAINWSDGHESIFNSEWLRKRRFTDGGRAGRLQWLKRKEKLWGSEIATTVPLMSFEDV